MHCVRFTANETAEALQVIFTTKDLIKALRLQILKLVVHERVKKQNFVLMITEEGLHEIHTVEHTSHRTYICCLIIMRCRQCRKMSMGVIKVGLRTVAVQKCLARKIL